jgi:RNA polymerase sigma-70 factor (ECF subfamily)
MKGDVMSTLETIFNRYEKVMLYSANKILGNLSLSEDAVQDAFISLVKHPDKILSIPIDDLKPYLIIVSENAARKLYYKQHKFNETPLDDADLFASDQEDTSIEKISLLNIFNMPQMNPEYRDIIVLRYYYDLDTKAIARALNISESNVRVRLTRARNLLRSIFEDGGIDDG